MNNNGSNFSLIRNKEINRIGPNFITPQFKAIYNLDRVMKAKDAWHEQIYDSNPVQIWMRNNDFKPNYSNEIFNPDYDKQYGIIGLKNFVNNIEKIRALAQNPRNDFLLLDNTGTVETMFTMLEAHNLKQIKCYILKDTPTENLIKYFERIYKSTYKSELI
jgi:hypothetical protein